MVTIRESHGTAAIAEIRGLFEEYARSLGIDLSFQGFDEELAGLPGAYSRPTGSLFLATTGDRPVGRVAVRRLDPDICEMKRLYVRSEARGTGVGRALVQAAVAFGRGAGYHAMRLDTLPTMVAAQALYRQFGFRDVPPYRHNPVPGTSFMELVLGSGPSSITWSRKRRLRRARCGSCSSCGFLESFAMPEFAAQ
jgi:ribosomal protein S18 acetylase RimI-like enzyme